MIKHERDFVPGFEARVRTLLGEGDENFTEGGLVEGLEAQLVRIDGEVGGPVGVGARGRQSRRGGRFLEEFLLDGELSEGTVGDRRRRGRRLDLFRDIE
jgi:hypothetical protein